MFWICCLEISYTIPYSVIPEMLRSVGESVPPYGERNKRLRARKGMQTFQLTPGILEQLYLGETPLPFNFI